MQHYPANMPDLNWDDLRHFLAFTRAGSFAGAARQLGVDETTIARRIRAITDHLGAPLVTRTGAAGAGGLTELGETVRARAETAEASILAISDDHATLSDAIRGTVRVTAVPLVVNHILLPALPQLAARHPQLRLSLLPEPRAMNLPGREADLALRLARPETGGTALAARKLGALEYGIFARAGHDPSGPWIGFDPSLAALPQAGWMRKSGLRADFLTGDSDTAMAAAKQGAGIAILPRRIAARQPELTEIARPDLPPPPSREIWLLSPRAQHHYARFRAVMDWIDQIGWR